MCPVKHATSRSRPGRLLTVQNGAAACSCRSTGVVEQCELENRNHPTDRIERPAEDAEIDTGYIQTEVQKIVAAHVERQSEQVVLKSPQHAKRIVATYARGIGVARSKCLSPGDQQRFHGEGLGERESRRLV